jgi:hypothetical protein
MTTNSIKIDICGMKSESFVLHKICEDPSLRETDSLEVGNNTFQKLPIILHTAIKLSQ